MRDESKESAYGLDSLLDKLLTLRQGLLESPERLGMYIGEVHVLSMNGFIQGYRSCQGMHGIEDERYLRFREWLRDVKGEFPAEGWWVKYLRDCDNDHLRAIRKYLDFAAEFHAMEQRGAC